MAKEMTRNGGYTSEPRSVGAISARIADRLRKLYGQEMGTACASRMGSFIAGHGSGAKSPAAGGGWSERDAVLIAYGDHVQAPPEKPLDVLRHVLDRHADGLFSTLHLLPFFPYSSDDGFSVVDFRAVSPDLGDWGGIQRLAAKRRLMVDLVLNHASARSDWFKEFVAGVAPARDYFVTADPQADLSAVVRPRTHPLLTKVATHAGERHVWTTFSADQVDLDYRNPDVLFEMLDILLFYVAMGARVIRLDAIAYLWKRIGTPCIHLPETHEVVKLMRDLLAIVAPDVILITETNVPHAENISYFGDGDEAQMVYQFSLPPLLLHAMTQGTARHLAAWAGSLPPPPPGCTFLNFTASHDGIGVRPLEGILPPADRDALVSHVRARGGEVSMKRNADGSESPYELNITWYDAMGGGPGEAADLHLARFLCSQAICFALRGVPAVYFGTLVAAPNDQAGVAATGRARSINRHKWTVGALETALGDTAAPASRALAGFKAMLAARACQPAFHPEARQEILFLDNRIFAVRRTAADGSSVLCLHNTAAVDVTVIRPGESGELRDLLGGYAFAKSLVLAPYAAVWLAAER